MDKLTVKISSLKNNLIYIFIFIFINILIFFSFVFAISSINKNYRDNYYTQISISLEKNQEYTKLYNFIGNVFEDVRLSNYFFRKGLDYNDNQFNLDDQYMFFFEEMSRAIFIDVLRPYDIREQIGNLSLSGPGSIESEVFTNNFLEITFNSKNDISSEVMYKISEIIDNKLNLMINVIFSKLEYYNSSNKNINDYLKINKDIKNLDTYLGNFFVDVSKKNVENYIEFFNEKINNTLRPKVSLRSEFKDFNNPLTSVLISSLIFSIIVTGVIFYMFFVLKNMIIFK